MVRLVPTVLMRHRAAMVTLAAAMALLAAALLFVKALPTQKGKVRIILYRAMRCVSVPEATPTTITAAMAVALRGQSLGLVQRNRDLTRCLPWPKLLAEA